MRSQYSQFIFRVSETDPTLCTYISEGIEKAKQMAETKSVNFPVNDGTTVIVSERIAGILASICGSIKAVKRAKDGVMVRHLYVPDFVSLDVNGIKKNLPLWQMVADEEQLHRVLEGEGRIRHDGSNSFLAENFRRDAWPETDADVVETKEATVKTGQTPEALRVKQRDWLDDTALYKNTIDEVRQLADGEVSDIVQAAYQAALESIGAGFCYAQTKAELCSYFLATCRNKTYELDRRRRKQRKTHSQITEQFAEGPLHHVRRVAPKHALDHAEKEHGAHRDSNFWGHARP
jgi:hypothetical protein